MVYVYLNSKAIFSNVIANSNNITSYLYNLLKFDNLESNLFLIDKNVDFLFINFNLNNNYIYTKGKY